MGQIMENKLPLHLQEVIFGSKESTISNQISKLLKAGALRKIAPRIYSPNMDEPVEEIIARNLFHILGNLYPGTILSHRSAFEFSQQKQVNFF